MTDPHPPEHPFGQQNVGMRTQAVRGPNGEWAVLMTPSPLVQIVLPLQIARGVLAGLGHVLHLIDKAIAEEEAKPVERKVILDA
jgi:hypothetical protein